MQEERNGEALLSERAGHNAGHESDSDLDERRVQFNRAKFHIEATDGNIMEEMELIGDEVERDNTKNRG